MRIIIRTLLCLICIGVSTYFFLNKPIQKYEDSSDYRVTMESAGGSPISSHVDSGKSLNDSENIGYGLAILFLGCGAAFALTKKDD